MSAVDLGTPWARKASLADRAEMASLPDDITVGVGWGGFKDPGWAIHLTRNGVCVVETFGHPSIRAAFRQARAMFDLREAPRGHA